MLKRIKLPNGPIGSDLKPHWQDGGDLEASARQSACSLEAECGFRQETSGQALNNLAWKTVGWALLAVHEREKDGQEWSSCDPDQFVLAPLVLCPFRESGLMTQGRATQLQNLIWTVELAPSESQAMDSPSPP